MVPAHHHEDTDEERRALYGLAYSNPHRLQVFLKNAGEDLVHRDEEKCERRGLHRQFNFEIVGKEPDDATGRHVGDKCRDDTESKDVVNDSFFRTCHGAAEHLPRDEHEAKINHDADNLEKPDGGGVPSKLLLPKIPRHNADRHNTKKRGNDFADQMRDGIVRNASDGHWLTFMVMFRDLKHLSFSICNEK